MKFSLAFIFFYLLISHPVMASTPALSDQPFLSMEQRINLYEDMVEEIENNDAEGIIARNAFKTVSWDQYVLLRRTAFIESQSWGDLAASFNAFSSGFVNLHSKFKFNSEFKAPSYLTKKKIGYTYPETKFFLAEGSMPNIKGFNDKNAMEVFSMFENMQCQFILRAGCLREFVDAFESGALKIDGKKISLVVTDKKIYPVKYSIDSSNPISHYLQPIREQNIKGWKTLKVGYKVALYHREGSLLLKIKDFVYPKGRGGDFRCSEDLAQEKSMCADIQLIREALSGVNEKNTMLLISIVNNGGGSENTPFIAELIGSPFEDLRIAFRNSKHFLDAKMRNHLFYQSSRAEQWFSTLKPNLPYGDFLPIRADFCRGGEYCELHPIKPNNQRKFKTTFILTNENCVSSCDDFVWRMQEFGGARVVGLPHSTDATYGRISIQYFLDAENKISKTFYADGILPEYQGIGLFSITVPFSKTVDKRGKARIGAHAPYEYIFPISRENYHNYETELINSVIR